MGNKQIDMLDILLIIAKHKKFIFLITLIVSIAAVIYVLIIPEMWVSTATILPTQEDRSQLSFGSSSSLLGLGSSLLGGAFQANGLDLLIIMNSRSFSENVIEKFNLIEYFEIEHEDSLVVKEETIKAFNENMRNIGINEENGLILISIESEDRYLSTDIANYYWQKLEEYNLENRMSKGKQKRIFLGKRILEVQDTLDSLSQTLMQFQKKNNIVELETQTTETVKLYANMIAQKTAKEIEMEFSRQINDTNSPILKKLIMENELLAEKISELELKKGDNKKFIISLSDIPELGLEYANIIMNLEIQELIYSYLYTQFEQARIEEIKDLPTIEVIDEATPSGLRSKPNRGMFCIIAFILALIISSCYIIVLDLMKKKVLEKENSERWSRFVRYLFRK